MTREAYFEMCEALGSDPLESEIPVEYSDLVYEAQEALTIYNHMQDEWEYMGGNYIGKRGSLVDIFTIYQVPVDMQRLTYELIMKIDSLRAAHIREIKPKTKTPA